MTKLAMTTLAQNSVWSSIVKSEQNHTIHSHNYAFAITPYPPTSFVFSNIATMGCFKVSIVGALTSIQFTTIKEKYLVCNVACFDILDFYKSNNPCYKVVEITTPHYYRTCAQSIIQYSTQIGLVPPE
jgi:hypothetical protein